MSAYRSDLAPIDPLPPFADDRFRDLKIDSFASGIARL